MAGTIQADFLQPQSNTGLFILSPTGSTMATVNTAGIYGSTGSLLVANTGSGLTTSNLTASGTITGNTVTSNTVVLTGSTSGSVTLVSPAVAGSNTVTIPSTGGTVMISGNMPAFSVYQSASSQTISNNTATKITLDAKNFDTNSNFSSNRFTPTVAGYYQINGGVSIGPVTGSSYASLYKNGSEAIRGTQSNVSWVGFVVSGLIYFNGSTDYVELYIYQGSGVSAITNNAASITYMNGCLVRNS